MHGLVQPRGRATLGRLSPGFCRGSEDWDAHRAKPTVSHLSRGPQTTPQMWCTRRPCRHEKRTTWCPSWSISTTYLAHHISLGVAQEGSGVRSPPRCPGRIYNSRLAIRPTIVQYVSSSSLVWLSALLSLPPPPLVWVPPFSASPPPSLSPLLLLCSFPLSPLAPSRPADMRGALRPVGFRSVLALAPLPALCS